MAPSSPGVQTGAKLFAQFGLTGGSFQSSRRSPVTFVVRYLDLRCRTRFAIGLCGKGRAREWREDLVGLARASLDRFRLMQQEASR